MEDSLLAVVEREGEGKMKRSNEGNVSRLDTLSREVKRVACIAAPTVAVNSSLYFLQIISTMMVGHLGELDPPHGLELLHHTLFPRSSLLDIGVQDCTSQPWSSSVNLDLALANVLFLVLYMNYSPNCQKTRSPISFAVFLGMGQFFRLAIPSASMICLEWWSFELLTLLSGLLPNPELEASVLSICLATIMKIYNIADGITAAASTRVSNELGVGKPQAACLSAYTAIILALSEPVIVSSALYALRHVFGYTFSYEKEVVDYVTDMAPLICLCVIINSFQAVLSGIASGCGWQHIGAYVNLGAYYVVGIPVAVGLVFWLKLNGKGLFIGIQVGAFCQTVMVFIVTCCTDWEKQAMKARERVLEGRLLE